VPVITRFGSEEGKDNLEPSEVTWIDVDIADAQERAWLAAWEEIGDQTRTLLLEPVRLSHREHLVDGMFLSLRTMQAGETDDLDNLTDLKLLIGKSRAITVRDGEIAAVDELRQFLRSGRSLVTPVDLLGFMVSGMTKRMEAIVFDLTRDTDAIEDQLLEDQIQAQRAETMSRSSLNLTIVATVFLPLTFVSGLLGMNVAGIPDEHNPWAFWVVTGSLVIVAFLAWRVLRRRMHD
jgi:Mg2+ and Co2+ transporter CorA